MIKRVSDKVDRKQAGWLLVGAGALAGAAVAYRLASGQSGSASLSSRVLRDLAELRDNGASLAQDGKQSLRQAGSNLDSLRASASEVAAPLRKMNPRGATRGYNGVLAALAAALLASGVAHYSRWRSAVRTSSPVLPVDNEPKNISTNDSLTEMKVSELRKVASEQDIEGRSSMNKDELIDALNDKV